MRKEKNKPKVKEQKTVKAISGNDELSEKDLNKAAGGGVSSWSVSSGGDRPSES
jgi:hypothetical protein